MSLQDKNQGLSGYLKTVLGRPVVLCLAAAGLITATVNVTSMMNQSRLLVLNRLRPNFGLIIWWRDLGREIPPPTQAAFELYYQKVVDWVGERADAFGLKGYFEYLQGTSGEALNSYEKAARLNPHFFWYHYNLGLIHFKEKNYNDALEALDAALGTSDRAAVVTIQNSRRIYLPLVLQRVADEENIITDPDFIRGELPRMLLEDRRNALLLKAVSAWNTGDYELMLGTSVAGVQAGLDRKGEFAYYAGLASFNLKQYRQAAAFLSEVLKKNQRDVEAIKLLAKTFDILNEKELSANLEKSAQVIEKVEGPGERHQPDLTLRIF